jgi:periplasmic divalent cation tolerance protein
MYLPRWQVQKLRYQAISGEGDIVGEGGEGYFARVASPMKNVPTKVLIVLVTTASQKEAVRIGEKMVSSRLAACANVIPGIKSIYRWNRKIVKSGETLLMLKSTELRYQALEKAIKAMHSYETPEIVALEVRAGFDQYMGWVRGETHV